MKKVVEDILLSRVRGEGSAEGEELGAEFVGKGGWIVHRDCTGNAERQWAVIGGQ
jgi:hypothetical protein